MNITTASQLTLKADITPADPGSSGKYTIGPNGQTLTIPSDADMVYSLDALTESGVGRDYEPYAHMYNAVKVLDPDGGMVSVDTVYAIILENRDASLSAGFSSTDMGTNGPAGDLQPGAFAVFHFPAGLTVGVTSAISIVGVSGAPTVRVTVIGRSA